MFILAVTILKIRLGQRSIGKKMTMNPTITVFMAAYNAAEYIKESIQSVLDQTYEDFELLIVNDGSTDDTVSVINSFQDPRIRLLHNPENKGLTYTRNVSLTASRGTYIAILDSDDIAYPNRLKLQYEFFKNHPEVALCGGHGKIINQHGMEVGGEDLIVPTGIDEVSATLLFFNAYVNSTVMYKTEVFKSLNGYQDYAPAEDYELFTRIAEHHAVGNLDEFLVRYRIHDNNTSIVNQKSAVGKVKQIKCNQLKKLGLPTDQHRIEVLYSLLTWDYTLFNIKDYLQLFQEIKSANRKLHKYPLKAFEKMLFEQWFKIIYTKKVKMNALSLYLNPALFNWSAVNFRQIRKVIKLSIRGLGKKSP